jgi:hypothetical protein
LIVPVAIAENSFVRRALVRRTCARLPSGWTIPLYAGSGAWALAAGWALRRIMMWRAAAEKTGPPQESRASLGRSNAVRDAECG